MRIVSVQFKIHYCQIKINNSHITFKKWTTILPKKRKMRSQTISKILRNIFRKTRDERLTLKYKTIRKK